MGSRAKVLTVDPRAKRAADRTLVLLPSLGTTSRIWDGTVQALASMAPRIEVLRMDLPGHGTGAVARAAFSVGDLAVEVAAAIESARSTHHVTVAGVSMGGAIALEIARRAPAWLVSFAMF